MHHPEGEDDFSYSLGQIIGIKHSTIYHSAPTCGGSSGSPLLNRVDFSVVGNHFGGNNKNNCAYKMKDILLDIKEKLTNINNLIEIIKNLKMNISIKKILIINTL